MTNHVIPIRALLVFDDDVAYRNFVTASNRHERRPTIEQLLSSEAARLVSPEIELDHENFEALADSEAAWMTEAAVTDFVENDTAQLRTGNRCLNTLIRELNSIGRARTAHSSNPLARVRARYVMQDDTLQIDGLYVPDLQRLCHEPERARVIRDVTGLGEGAMQFLESFVKWAWAKMSRAQDAEIASLLDIPIDEATELANAVIGHGVGLSPDEVGRLRH